jgi:hypothetical protein
MFASFSTSPVFPAYPILQRTNLSYLLLCMIAGLYAGLGRSPLQWPGLVPDMILWGMIGLAIGCAGLWIEFQLMACRRSTLIGGSLGIIVGMAGTGLFFLGMGLALPPFPFFSPWTMLPMALLCPYIGMVVGIQ